MDVAPRINRIYGDPADGTNALMHLPLGTREIGLKFGLPSVHNPLSASDEVLDARSAHGPRAPPRSSRASSAWRRSLRMLPLPVCGSASGSGLREGGSGSERCGLEARRCEVAAPRMLAPARK